MGHPSYFIMQLTPFLPHFHLLQIFGPRRSFVVSGVESKHGAKIRTTQPIHGTTCTQFCHSAMLPCCHVAILSCCHSAILPWFIFAFFQPKFSASHSTIPIGILPLYQYSIVPLFRSYTFGLCHFAILVPRFSSIWSCEGSKIRGHDMDSGYEWYQFAQLNVWFSSGKRKWDNTHCVFLGGSQVDDYSMVNFTPLDIKDEDRWEVDWVRTDVKGRDTNEVTSHQFEVIYIIIC